MIFEATFCVMFAPNAHFVYTKVTTSLSEVYATRASRENDVSAALISYSRDAYETVICHFRGV